MFRTLVLNLHYKTSNLLPCEGAPTFCFCSQNTKEQLKCQKDISEATFMHEKCPHFLQDFPLRLLVPFEEGHQQFLQPKLGF